jgi:hypothetical protein
MGQRAAEAYPSMVGVSLAGTLGRPDGLWADQMGFGPYTILAFIEASCCACIWS